MWRSVACALTAMNLWAQSAPELRAPHHLPRLVWEDTRFVIGAPVKWGSRGWTWAGLGVAAVAGAYALDGRVDEGVRRDPQPALDRVARAVEPFGGMGGILLVGGAYGYGHLAGNPSLRNAAADAGVAVLITRAVFVVPLKGLVGRARPDEGLGPRHFEVFHGEAFPSGHSAQAFALAAVLSVHAGRHWVTGLGYGLATLVAAGRVQQRQHHLSDALAGGLLGTAIGLGVAHHNLELGQERKLRARLEASGPLGQPGLAIRVNF